jgi:hypothetical protein
MQAIRFLYLFKTIILCTASLACTNMTESKNSIDPSKIVLEIIKQGGIGNPTVAAKLLGINLIEEPGGDSQPLKAFILRSDTPSSTKQIVSVRMTISNKHGSDLNIEFANSSCSSLSDLSKTLNATAYTDMYYQHVQTLKGGYLNPVFLGHSFNVRASPQSNAEVRVKPFDSSCFSSFHLWTRK